MYYPENNALVANVLKLEMNLLVCCTDGKCSFIPPGVVVFKFGLNGENNEFIGLY